MQSDWQATLRDAKKASQKHDSWTDIARAIDVPRTTLSEGLDRVFGIRSIADLQTYDTTKAVAYGVSIYDLLNRLRQGPATLTELADMVDRGPGSVSDALNWMIRQGYQIEEDDTTIQMPLVPPSCKAPVLNRTPDCILRLMIMADTHFASKWEQPTALQCAIQDFYDDGGRNILHAGDWLAGRWVYRGQDQELYALGMMQQVEAALSRLPKLDGLHYWGIGGNHDYSWYKNTGIDALALLERERSDIHILGYDAADVPLQVDGDVPTVEARLWHGRGGGAYSKSYKPQKYVEGVTQNELFKTILGEKPRPTIQLVVIGHFHVQGEFPFGPIETLMAGCWEGQTNYLKARGLIPAIGCYTVELEIKDSMIQDIGFHRLQFGEIKDDWANYPVPSMKDELDREKVQAIFTLEEEG